MPFRLLTIVLCYTTKLIFVFYKYIIVHTFINITDLQQTTFSQHKMFPIHPQFAPQFFWTMVVATQVFIEGDEDCFSSPPHRVKPIPNWVKQKFDKFRRATGCCIVLYEAQPEFQRPKPFYLISGTWEGVIRCQSMIQQMMCEYTAEKCAEYDERYDINKACSVHIWTIEIPKDVPLWKCLKMEPSSLRCEDTETSVSHTDRLNSWCVEGTKVVIECLPQFPGESPCPCKRVHYDLPKEDQCQIIHIEGAETIKVRNSRRIIECKIFQNLNSE